MFIFRYTFSWYHFYMKSFIDNILKNKKKKFSLNTKNMGVDIDKNEFFEIKLSNSNHPEDIGKKNG